MNTIKEHGISIGIHRVDALFFIKMKIEGTLTHSDYEMMIPMIESAIAGVKEPKIKVLIDAEKFDGWELRAMWDDFKFGLEFQKLFTKIAFVGTKILEEYGIKIGSWFMSGEIKFFKSMDEAHEWLNKEEAAPATPVQKDLKNRKDEIRDDLEALFKNNIKITDWNVPEADDQNASEVLITILQEKLDEIKEEIQNQKYKNY
ncbi:MAG: STAS/SEC14 domain-containing protein [Sulfurimonas sp.]|jgi:hypothetical protein